MKVTLLAQFFPPETFAGANRIGAMANALAAGADVQVVTLQPSYPDPSAYDHVDWTSPWIDAGVGVRRTRCFAPHGRSWVERALAEQRMALGLLLAAAPQRTDVVIASSPGMFLGPAGLALAFLRRAPFVWDIRDLTWRYARERATGSVSTLTTSALERSMWAVARRADLLVAATPGIASELRAARLGTRVAMIGNSVGAELLARLDPSYPAAPARPAVTYAGLVGHAQALRVLCDVAERLPEIDVHLAGEGPERVAIADEARRRSLRNLVCHGYVQPSELSDLYRQSDILFAQLHRSALHTATALPSKLWEYMAAARPIVYAGDGLAARTLRETGAGVAVEPGSADEIVAAIRGLLADRDAARAMGEVGRRFVEHQPSRQAELGALLPELQRLAARGRRMS